MSEELSDIDDGTAEQRAEYRRRLEDAVQMSEHDREAGVAIWEVRRPAYRPQWVRCIGS